MKKTLEYVGVVGQHVTQDNKEKLTHGTSEFRMSAHKTMVLPGVRLALYYHWHDELEIFYLSKGNLRFCLGSKEFILREGEITIIPCEVPHVAYREDLGEIEFYAVDVHINFLSSQENDLIQSEYILPVFMGWRKVPERILKSMDQHPLISQSIACILDFYKMEYPGYELMIKSSLYQIFYQLITITEKSDTHEENYYNTMWVKQMLYFIQSNYSQKITLKDMASYVSMSDSYLCRSCKRVFKISPMKFLNQYRISQAVSYIESTDRKLGEIAFDTGFSNVNRFTESFKKFMLCTPLEYRQKVKAEVKGNKNL